MTCSTLEHLSVPDADPEDHFKNSLDFEQDSMRIISPHLFSFTSILMYLHLLSAAIIIPACLLHHAKDNCSPLTIHIIDRDVACIVNDIETKSLDNQRQI